MKRIIRFILPMMVGINAGIAEEAATSQLPIHEITVFKDGHAFIQHSGTMPVGETGEIVMDYLPAPVLGTFWPYADDENVTLRSVVSATRKVEIERTALSIREMIEANIGARVIIRQGETTHEVTLEGIPKRTTEELESYAGPAASPQLPVKSDMVLVRTTEGVRTVPFSSISDITFLDKQRAKLNVEEFRDRLTLGLSWKDKPESEAHVGMIYLQRGIRWIPNYSVSIDDSGKAVLKLEATLINELIDLDDVTANLVIGVPSFAFKDSVDPISLRENVAQLSSSFRNNSQTALGLSNAIMTQQAMPMMDYDNVQPGGGGPLNLGPELAGSAKSEDLYIFTIDHISLRKGERMVVPIAQYDLSYTDIYALDIPIVPPMEMLRNLSQSDRMNLLRTSFSPTVMHKIRIQNKSENPFTTAPVMILKNDRIIAQGMMKYTPIGGHADIELTTAVDINVKKSDNETQRTANAVLWNGDQYTRIDLAGTISLKNYKNEPVTVEITRHVLGNLNTVGEDGAKEMVNPLEDKSYLPDDQSMDWWYRYSWPWWWYRFNGIGRASWISTLEPGGEIEHTYTWHYFWQ